MKSKQFAGKLAKPRKYNPYFKRADELQKEVDSLKKNPEKSSGKYQNIVDALLERTENIILEEAKLDEEMMSMLIKHYDIDPQAKNIWAQLSFALALDFVPGFRYEKAPRGRKNKWTNLKNMQLVSEVNAYLKGHPNHSAKAACIHHAKRNTFGVTNPNSLYTRYQEAKKQPVNALAQYVK